MELLEIFKQPPLASVASDAAEAFQILEKRLANTYTTNNEATQSEDESISCYLSYATHAATIKEGSAVSVYERCVAHFAHRSDVWMRYIAFCNALDPTGVFCVASRASRAIPDELRAWAALAASVPSAPVRIAGDRCKALGNVVRRATPFVMRSDALRDAARLTIAVWTAFAALRLPTMLDDSANASLAFNIDASVEWASATCHAASVLLAARLKERAARLFERVVAARPEEARWWLRYANSATAAQWPDLEVVAIFERAVNAVPCGVMLDVVEDAWRAFEVEWRGRGDEEMIRHSPLDSVVDRVMHVANITNDRRSGVGGARYEHQELNGAPDKRRRRDRSGSKTIKRRRNDQASKTASKKQTNKTAADVTMKDDTQGSEPATAVNEDKGQDAMEVQPLEGNAEGGEELAKPIDRAHTGHQGKERKVDQRRMTRFSLSRGQYISTTCLSR